MGSSRVVRRRSVRVDAGHKDDDADEAVAFRALVLFLAVEAPTPILPLVFKLLPFCAAARLACVHARLNDAWQHVRSQGSQWDVFWRMRTSGEVVLCYEEMKEFRFKNANHVSMVPHWLRVKCSISETIDQFVRCVVRQECHAVLERAFHTMETRNHSKDVLDSIRLWYVQLCTAFGNLQAYSSGFNAGIDNVLKIKMWCAAFASPFYTRFIRMHVRDLFIAWKTSAPDVAFQFVLASALSPDTRVLELLLTDWYVELLDQPERWNLLITHAAKSPTPFGLLCVLKIFQQRPSTVIGENMKLEICRECFRNNPVNFLYVFNVIPQASVPTMVRIVSQLFEVSKYYCSSRGTEYFKYTLFMRTFDIILENPAIWLPYIVTRFFDPVLQLSPGQQLYEAHQRLFLFTIIGHAGMVQHVIEACVCQPWWGTHGQTFVSTVVTKASWRDRTSVLRYILTAHADEVTEESWQEAVRNAALRGHPEPLRQLLEFGVAKRWTPDTRYGTSLLDEVKKTHFTRRDECVALLK